MKTNHIWVIYCELERKHDAILKSLIFQAVCDLRVPKCAKTC